jgi:hypothetical protein
MGMKELREFDKFAKDEGREVVNGCVVMFGLDEAAAQAFADKTRKAGLQALVELIRVEWTIRDKDRSDAFKVWGVTLL